MYINVTIDLKRYKHPPIEFRLSNQHSIKKLIDISWQTTNLPIKPREGFWIRVQNKDKTYAGTLSQEECRITKGDNIEILKQNMTINSDEGGKAGVTGRKKHKLHRRTIRFYYYIS